MTDKFAKIEVARERLDIDIASLHLIHSEDVPPRETPPLSAYEDEPLLASSTLVRVNGHASPGAPTGIVLRQIAAIVAEQREAEWLLHKILEQRVLAVLAGPRGTFKSFVALHWAMRMAVGGHAGVVLSGEGAGLDRRIRAWMKQHGANVDLAGLPLVALERPLNLSVSAEIDALSVAIAALSAPPTFIVVDTLSKFSAGLDENDNSRMAEFLSGLTLHLRDGLGASVLLVAHSGHGDVKRPRGASSLMANPDCEYIVERPVGSMTVTVSRERFKDVPAMPALAYEATVIDLARKDRYGEPVTSLALVDADAPVKAKAGGRNQEKALTALREWARANPEATNITSIDLKGLFKAQRLDYKRRPEVMDHMVNVRILTPSIGGFTFDRAML